MNKILKVLLSLLLALALTLSFCACSKPSVDPDQEHEKESEQDNPGKTDPQDDPSKDPTEDPEDEGQAVVYAYQEFTKFLAQAKDVWGELYITIGYTSLDPNNYEYKGMLDDENFIFGLKEGEVTGDTLTLGLFYVDKGENPDIWCHDLLVEKLGLASDYVRKDGKLVPTYSAFEEGSKEQKMANVAIAEIKKEMAEKSGRNNEYFELFDGFVHEKNKCLGITCDWFIEDKDGPYAEYILKDYQDCMFVRLGYQGSGSASLFSCIVRETGESYELVKVTQEFN